MTLYLRTDSNDTVVDIDCWVKIENDHRYVELSASIDIMKYSALLLLQKSMTAQAEIAADFHSINELRGWLWEIFFMGSTNDPERYDEVIVELKKTLIEIGLKYDLHLITD